MLAFSEGSIASASKIMHLSQPAISRLISGLEHELKLQLFDRSGRNLTPTDEGMAFYQEAGRILDSIEEIPRIARDIRNQRVERLRVACMSRALRLLAVPVVAAFHRQHPNHNIRLDIRARRDAGKLLASETYHVGIGVLPFNRPSIATQPLVRSRMMAVVPKGHHLTRYEEISADLLTDEVLIRLTYGLLLREQIDTFFHAAGIIPHRTIEVSSSEAACSLVAEGCGVTIVDEMVAKPYQDSIERIPLVPETWTTYGLLLPKTDKPLTATPKFTELLTLHIESISRDNSNIQLI